MKYIDWMRRRINILRDTKIIDFPETPEMIERKIVTEEKKIRYFHEVWPEEEAELKISLEASKAAKAERTEQRRQKRKEKRQKLLIKNRSPLTLRAGLEIPILTMLGRH